MQCTLFPFEKNRDKCGTEKVQNIILIVEQIKSCRKAKEEIEIKDKLKRSMKKKRDKQSLIHTPMNEGKKRGD